MSRRLIPASILGLLLLWASSVQGASQATEAILLPPWIGDHMVLAERRSPLSGDDVVLSGWCPRGWDIIVSGLPGKPIEARSRSKDDLEYWYVRADQMTAPLLSDGHRLDITLTAKRRRVEVAKTILRNVAVGPVLLLGTSRTDLPLRNTEIREADFSGLLNVRVTRPAGFRATNGFTARPSSTTGTAWHSGIEVLRDGSLAETCTAEVVELIRQLGVTVGQPVGIILVEEADIPRNWVNQEGASVEPRAARSPVMDRLATGVKQANVEIAQLHEAERSRIEQRARQAKRQGRVWKPRTGEGPERLAPVNLFNQWLLDTPPEHLLSSSLGFRIDALGW